MAYNLHPDKHIAVTKAFAKKPKRKPVAKRRKLVKEPLPADGGSSLIRNLAYELGAARLRK